MKRRNQNRGQKEEQIRELEFLEQQRLTCLVATSQQIQNMGYFERISSAKSTYIVSPIGVKELLKRNNYLEDHTPIKQRRRVKESSYQCFF